MSLTSEFGGFDLSAQQNSNNLVPSSTIHNETFYFKLKIVPFFYSLSFRKIDWYSGGCCNNG